MTDPHDPEDLTFGATGEGTGPALGGFDMGDLLSQALDMQRQMAEAQEELGATDVVGETGGVRSSTLR